MIYFIISSKVPIKTEKKCAVKMREKVLTNHVTNVTMSHKLQIIQYSEYQRYDYAYIYNPPPK